jgi:DNA-binding MarR family transcriptional regulator
MLSGSPSPYSAAADTGSLELASRLRLAITRTARRLRQEAAAEITPTQTAVLATIERHGPLTPSELATRERVSRPTATRALRSLLDAGLADRQADPNDGRSALVSINASGSALLRKLRSRKNAYLARRLRELDPDEVEALDRAAAILERVLERDAT